MKENISTISLCFHQNQISANKLRLQISKVPEALIQTNNAKLLFFVIDLTSQVEEWEMERETGFEPATSTLARLRSTNWAILAFAVKRINSILSKDRQSIFFWSMENYIIQPCYSAWSLHHILVWPKWLSLKDFRVTVDNQSFSNYPEFKL